jgi:hypothetical protein
MLEIELDKIQRVSAAGVMVEYRTRATQRLEAVGVMVEYAVNAGRVFGPAAQMM